MVDFKSLLEKSKNKKAEETVNKPTGPKPNPFASLAKKTNAIKATTTKVVVPKPAPKPAPVIDEMNVNPAEIESKGAAEFQFPDQPGEYNEQAVAEFKDAFDTLYSGFDNKELISEALKHIMILLRKHEFLKDILLPEHCGKMVEALRVSYGRVITTKNQRVAKVTKANKDVDEVMKDLDGLDIQI